MERFSDKFYDEADQNVTLRRIKKALQHRLIKQFPDKDNDWIIDRTENILKINGLDALHFNFVHQAERIITERLNDVSIDDNSNKNEKTMACIFSEIANPIKKAVGFDYLYRVLKELYGKNEAKRLSSLMYDYSIGLSDSSNIMVPYCFALDASRLVTEGRHFGQLRSKPAKRVSSYISALCETIHQMSSHFAGALAVGTFFFDIAHILLVKQKIDIDDYFNDPVKVKALENEYQQFVHSVNHLSRSGAESPFTNISIFDKVKIRHLVTNDLAWYFTDIDTELVIETVKRLQNVFIEFFDKGDPLSSGMPYRFPVVTVNFSKILTDNGWEVEDKETLNEFCKTDAYRYNIFMSEGTKTASCCFEGNEQIKVTDENGIDHYLTLKQLFELLNQTDSLIDKQFDTGLTIESFIPSENKKEQAKIVGLLKKNFTGKMITLNVNGNSIKVTSDHKFEAKRKSDGEIVEITAIELANNYKDYLLPSL